MEAVMTEEQMAELKAFIVAEHEKTRAVIAAEAERVIREVESLRRLVEDSVPALVRAALRKLAA